MKSRKILALLIVTVMLFLFGSCNRKQDSTQSSSTSSCPSILNSSEETVISSSSLPPSTSSAVSTNTSSTKQVVQSEVPPTMTTEAFLNSLNEIKGTINAKILAYDGNFIYHLSGGSLKKFNPKTGDKSDMGISTNGFYIKDNILVNKRRLSWGTNDKDEFTWRNLSSGTAGNISSDIVIKDFFVYGGKVFYTLGSYNAGESSSQEIYVFDTNQNKYIGNDDYSHKFLKEAQFYDSFISGKYLYAKGVKKSDSGPTIPGASNYEGVRLNMETLEVKFYGSEIEFVKPLSFFTCDSYVIYKNLKDSSLYLMENNSGNTLKLPSSITEAHAIINNQIISFGDFYSIAEKKLFKIKLTLDQSFIGNRTDYPRNFFNGGISFYTGSTYPTSLLSYFSSNSSYEMKSGYGASSVIFKLDNWIYTISKRTDGLQITDTFANTRFKADDTNVVENDY